MTSVVSQYAQRDNRLEIVSLTGNISNNGSIAGTPAEQNPAYAAIDLTKSKSFSIDASVLTLRSGGDGCLLRVYISSSKPPLHRPNFEFDIFITPPVNNGNGERIFIEIYANKAAAENAQIVGNAARLYGISNELPTSPGDYSDTTGILTFKVLNNAIILKSISPSYSN